MANDYLWHVLRRSRVMRYGLVAALLFATAGPLPCFSQTHTDVEAVSLLGRELRPISFSVDQAQQLKADLEAARQALRREPDKVDHHIWVGRRLGYLWKYKDAIDVYSRAMQQFPEEAQLYRHRGHRYITLREFRKAEEDLRHAAKLIAGTRDIVEPDGQPNAAGIPTSTLQTNIWYHLGLAQYLQGKFEPALASYRQCLQAATNNDMSVATLDWMYMTMRRLNRDADAAAVIGLITPETKLIENFAYHRRLLMYRGLLSPDELLNPREKPTDLDLATQGYGVGNWYLCEHQHEKARAIFESVVAGDHWAAFGFIAAEADLARMKQSDGAEGAGAE